MLQTQMHSPKFQAQENTHQCHMINLAENLDLSSLVVGTMDGSMISTLLTLARLLVQTMPSQPLNHVLVKFLVEPSSEFKDKDSRIETSKLFSLLVMSLSILYLLEFLERSMLNSSLRQKLNA